MTNVMFTLCYISVYFIFHFFVCTRFTLIFILFSISPHVYLSCLSLNQTMP